MITNLLIFLTNVLISGYLHGESTTHIPINRGAARQMYGSGSLRQTSSGPNSIDTTVPTDQEDPKPPHAGRNGIHPEDKSHVAGTWCPFWHWLETALRIFPSGDVIRAGVTDWSIQTDWSVLDPKWNGCLGLKLIYFEDPICLISAGSNLLF